MQGGHEEVKGQRAGEDTPEEIKEGWVCYVLQNLCNTEHTCSGTPLKCKHLALTDVLLRYGLHFHAATRYNPWNADCPLFCKADLFFGSFRTWSVQDSVDSADAHLSLMQGCPHHWSVPTTEHYNSTGTYSTSLLLAFLTSLQQGRGFERGLVELNNASALPHLLEMYQKPPKYGYLYILDTQRWSQSVCIERFHCKCKRHSSVLA